MQLLHEFGQPLDLTTLVLRIVVAVLIGAVIGIDREIKNRPAGMRTHVLVCVGAALVSLIEQGYVADVVALGLGSTVNASMGRITSTVVSGVGFLGAGTIFVAEHKISGLTTAASLWCTACIGLAVGAVSDIVGALLFTGWNPWLTIPMALTGALTAVVAKALKLEAGSEKHGSGYGTGAGRATGEYDHLPI